MFEKFIFCTFIFLANIFFFQISLVFSQEIQKSTDAPADIGAELPQIEDLDINESTETYKPGSVRISEGMLKKIKKMEQSASEIKGGDDAALELIGGKIGRTIVSMPLNQELISVVKDKSIDWRVRCLLILHKTYTTSQAKIDKYSGDFIEIMKDKTQHERVRAVCALILLDISKKNEKAKTALTEMAKAEDTPGEVLKAVMTVVGYGGIDDADVLMKLTERGPANFNKVGINLNAIRALGKSKDPRAFGYLIKIFDESVPDSFFNYTAMVTMWNYVKDPEKLEQVKILLAPRLLKLLDDRSRLGPSRREAAAILAELQIQEAVEPLLKWFLPRENVHGGVIKNGVRNDEMYCNGRKMDKYCGGNTMDILVAARALTKLGDKQAIPVLEKFVENFPYDSRWTWEKKYG